MAIIIHRLQWMPTAAVLLVILLILFFLPSPHDEVAFLDIGQGDSVLLQSGTKQVLIDGGPDTTVLQRLVEEMPWFDRTIDVVIATHPDKDHIGGLLDVVKRYDVKLVLLSYVPHDSHLQESWLVEIQEKIEKRGTVFRFVWAGEEMDVGTMKFTFLWPTVEWAQTHTATTNDNSVVARVDFNGTSFLLSGDAGAPVENQLVNSTSAHLLDVDVLKAGHHGSKSSTTSSFIRAASPGIVPISVGARNTYGHPNPDTLDRLKDISIVRTDLAGTIRFLHFPEGWFLSCSKEPCLSER